MLEQKIDELIAAVKELTAATKAKGGDASTGTASGAKAGAKGGAAKPKYTAEKVKAKILEVKEKHGMDRAKEIIAEAGGDDLANLLTQPAKFDNAYALAEAALEDEAPAADDGDGL